MQVKVCTSWTVRQQVWLDQRAFLKDNDSQPWLHDRNPKKLSVLTPRDYGLVAVAASQSICMVQKHPQVILIHSQDAEPQIREMVES